MLINFDYAKITLKEIRIKMNNLNRNIKSQLGYEEAMLLLCTS